MAPTPELTTFPEVWIAVWSGILLGRHVFWDVPAIVLDTQLHMKFWTWLVLLGTVFWPWLLYLNWWKGFKKVFSVIVSFLQKKGK